MNIPPEHDLHILIVAKRLHSGRAIANRLRNIGYDDVVSLQRGEDALDFLEHGRADVVVVTKRLKDMKGAQFAGNLRSQGNEQPPILLACDQITREEALSAVEHGIDDIMIEPHSRNKFVAKIGALYEGSPTNNSAPMHRL